MIHTKPKDKPLQDRSQRDTASETLEGGFWYVLVFDKLVYS